MKSALTKVIFFPKPVQSKLKSSSTVDRNVYHWQADDGTTGLTLNAPNVCDVVSWLLCPASFEFCQDRNIYNVYVRNISFCISSTEYLNIVICYITCVR